MTLRRAHILHCFAAAVLTAWVTGCTSTDNRHTVLHSVRQVDVSKAPGCELWANRMRDLGNEVYPKILAILTNDGIAAPPEFDIIFTPLKSRNVGEAHFWPRGESAPQIRINADYFASLGTNTHWLGTNAAQLDDVLVHEMAHIAQFRRRVESRAYWDEGLCDYVRYKLDYITDADKPCCTIDFPHYASGYSCAGAFLLFIDLHYDFEIGRKLNHALRRRSYSNEFFRELTGKSVNELWAEFQRTPAFTADAKRVNRIQSRLGYIDGVPPKDLDARYEALVLRTRGGTNTMEALRFVRRLGEKGSLPGFAKDEKPRFVRGERGGGSFVAPKEKEPDTFPIRRSLYCYNAEREINYTVVRDAASSAWRLERAWENGADGKPIREFPVRK